MGVEPDVKSESIATPCDAERGAVTNVRSEKLEFIT